MVADNDSAHNTAFTVSVDFKHGTTTGISADDRTLTVRNLANGNAGAADFVRPGHVFPLIARDGGVLMRSGHTEAAVDLCKLTGLPPVGVICELVNDDGTVMRGQQVQTFAAMNGLKQISVADLIAYRQRQENLVERVDCIDIDTPAGMAKVYTYALPGDATQHLAIVFGDILDGSDMPVHLYCEDIVNEVFGRNNRLRDIIASVREQSREVIIYLRGGSVDVGLKTGDRDAGDREVHMEARRRDREWREFGLGAQILRDLGISSITLRTPEERHYLGLAGFGIDIADMRTR